jgi:hypothetical protein
MTEERDFTMDTSITTSVINAHFASTDPTANITDIWKTFSSECISPEHLDVPSVCNNADMEHAKQTHQEQQMVLYSAEHNREMFPSCRPSQSKHKATSKIPRPPNAFLLFANKWRKTLSMQYPWERNKEISIRLGVMWKSMKKEEKDVYMAIAREVKAEHKKKYPDYVYCPKEARIQKALRMGGRKQKNLNKRCHTVTAALPIGSACEEAAQSQQSWNIHHQALQPRDTSRQPHSLLPSRTIAEQQRSLEEIQSTIREQVEQVMIQESTETYTYIQL